ncbi:MAG TPA: hypothetical protein VKH81_19680 [Candidatus Angelobacter sp.]|nr:hypothetical protein [Candidatus Angelobacter sp.]
MRNNLNQQVSNHRRNSRAAVAAIRGLVLALVALAVTGIASAQDNVDVKFKSGIGVIPVTGVAANGTVNLNIVRGVNPAGPWRIADLDAVVESNGHISVRGRGLLLAAGNGIGTNAGASVHATLFCGPAATATAFDEAGVPLASDGDFVIDDFLTGNGSLPTPCENPVLLIRSGALPGQGVWFAAGIQKLEDEHSQK